MTETRREVFKLSVLSAFGVLAAGSVAKAADFSATKIIARATQGRTDYDVLIDASTSPAKAWVLAAPHYGEPLKNVPSGSTPANGTYYIATSASGSPSFTCSNGTVTNYSNIAANAWNEIGSRQHVKCSSVR